MKPIKSFALIASWCLRISILLFMLVMYWSEFKNIDFQHLTLHTLLAFVYCLFGILLFIGGFQRNASLTVISAIIVFLISIYLLFTAYKGDVLDVSFLIYVFPFSIGLYFLSNGNN